jgi:phage terminase small subunit
LRTAVESVVERRTKDGKLYGVKLDTRGRITAKQRLFASLIVQGLSPRESYRKAYNCLTANESTIATSANRLMNDPKVSVLLQSSLDKREENLVSDAVATRRHVMTELLAHAKDMKSEGSKLKALELIGRAVGMFTDKVETKVEEVSTDQLKRELETHLALLDGATKH